MASKKLRFYYFVTPAGAVRSIQSSDKGKALIEAKGLGWYAYWYTFEDAAKWAAEYSTRKGLGPGMRS